MCDSDKFRADIRRIKKHERMDNGGKYDGFAVSKKVGDLFCRYNPSLQDLSNSIVEYWIEKRISTVKDMQDEPSEANIDWLVAALSFLSGELDETDCFTLQDWKKMAELVNYEAEDLPLDILSPMMSILVEKKAF